MDILERPLQFHWVVLRGDASRIRIDSWGAREEVARIAVPYHHRRPVSPGEELQSNRVDIGVFAENPGGLSAPCFITFYSLPNERRRYDEDGRLLEITYEPTGRENFADPRLTATKRWRDVYRYDESGGLAGWHRRIGGEWVEYTAGGQRVTKRNHAGKVVASEPVRYVVNERTGLLEARPASKQAGASIRNAGPDTRDTRGTPKCP